MSLYAAGSSYQDGIIEYDFFYEPWTFHYFAADFEPDGYDCVRDTSSATIARKRIRSPWSSGAVREQRGTGRQSLRRAAQDDCVLEPGEEARLIFMLGVGPRDKGREIRRKYSDHGERGSGFAELRSYWQEKLAVFQCRTPHAGPGHHGEHLDALPGGDLRGLVALCLVRRGRRPHRPRVIATPRRTS